MTIHCFCELSGALLVHERLFLQTFEQILHTASWLEEDALTGPETLQQIKTPGPSLFMITQIPSLVTTVRMT